MEVSEVRKRVLRAIAAARANAQERRQRVADAQRAWGPFLEDVAAPIFRHAATVLKAEGFAFTLSTPADGVRLSYDRGRDDFVEVVLDSSSDRPEVIGRISRTRGSRRVDEARPIRPGAAPDALTDEDVLQFLVDALQPWLER